MLKKLLIHTRKSMKLIILIAIALLLILGVISSFYKVSYSVNINGELVGYTDDKSKLQALINDYIERGEEENTAFVQVDNLPEYNMCLLKKDVSSNDNEIINSIKDDGTTYYRYYAILENQEEKIYVSNFTEAEDIVNQLKQKSSSNIETITISEKYETNLANMTTVEEAVSQLFVAPKDVLVASTNTKDSNSKNTNTKKSTGTANVSSNTSLGKVNLGVSLVRPVSGVISARFAENSSIRRSSHTGLDIAASTGTPVVAAASGKVTFSGWKGSYGNMMVITHSNGVQTYYAHCSKLYFDAGATVSQGQVIGTVGSTGNSTGPHLHLEIRVNGVAYNPQNYLY
ncbi:MAG: M23 family metallopeptidase [Clostridia bacterium]|nr:M23 family metallopeptidase [Clostridia bacterium]